MGPVTVAFRVIRSNPTHTDVTVWVGRNPGSRGYSGELILRTDELAELADSGWVELHGDGLMERPS